MKRINGHIEQQVVLSLGGNVGNVEESFAGAISDLEKKLGSIERKSSLYKSQAWGKPNQIDFLNQMVIVRTLYSPVDVLKFCQQIETSYGRDRAVEKRWEERTLDIDILFYGDQIINQTNLVVPHPRLYERNFILIPMEEIIPDFVHPVFNKTVRQLLEKCRDNLNVVKY